MKRRNFKVGDIVYWWHETRNIQGTVIEIMEGVNPPVIVRFSSSQEGFTAGGQFFIDGPRILFFAPVNLNIPTCAIEVEKEDHPNFDVDTKLLVWNDIGNKKQRHFSHFDELDRCCCFVDGRTSWTTRYNREEETSIWKNYKVIK